LDCPENGELVQEVNPRSVEREPGRLALSDSMRGKDLLAFGSRRLDNTRALSDEERRQMLSSIRIYKCLREWQRSVMEVVT
jgi:hypothetical protein